MPDENTKASKAKSDKPRMDTMMKVKLIAIIAIAVVAVIVFLQNTETVETKFLLLTIPMSRALLLILTFVAGFAAGMIATTQFMRKRG
jgi:uncharacterized integral membrane protein